MIKSGGFFNLLRQRLKFGGLKVITLGIFSLTPFILGTQGGGFKGMSKKQFGYTSCYSFPIKFTLKSGEG